MTCKGHECPRDGDCPDHGRNRPGQCVPAAGGLWPRRSPLPAYPIDSFADYVGASLPPDLERQPTTHGLCKTCGQPNDYERRTEILFLQRALEQRNKTIRDLKSQLTNRGKELSELGQWRMKAHHADYSKPLDIEWLCRKCHARRHEEEEASAWYAAEVARMAERAPA